MAQFRLWLGALFSSILILFIADDISFYWYEISIREAIINEQGWIYFVALRIRGILILTGAITGVIFRYKTLKCDKKTDGGANLYFMLPVEKDECQVSHSHIL